MIVASLLTKPNSKEALDRLYVKMKTPVDSDPANDKAQMERSYAQPDRFDDRKLFPNSNLEFQRPTPRFLGVHRLLRDLFRHHRPRGPRLRIGA